MVWAVTTAKEDFILTKRTQKYMRTSSLHSVLWINFRGIEGKTYFCTLQRTWIMFFLWKVKKSHIRFSQSLFMCFSPPLWWKGALVFWTGASERRGRPRRWQPAGACHIGSTGPCRWSWQNHHPLWHQPEAYYTLQCRSEGMRATRRRSGYGCPW